MRTSPSTPSGKGASVETTVPGSPGLMRPIGLDAQTRKDLASRRALQWPYAVTRPARERARAILRTTICCSSIDSGHGLERRLLVFLVCAELRNVGPRAPHAERLGRERELPRPVARFLLGEDVLHPDRVLVDHLVRPLEVQEARRR